MEKYSSYLFILILCASCNKNVANLEAVIQNRRVRVLVNEYVTNILSKNSSHNIYVTGTTAKNSDTIEISLYNQRPVFYTDNDMDYLNTYIKSKQFGIFKYKGVNFYVTNDLRDIFNLNYKSFDYVKDKFDKQTVPEPTDYYSMFININKKDSSIIYYSNLSKESLKWKEIK